MSKNDKNLFFGCGTAIITPFSNGEIDFESFGKLIDRQLSAEVSAIIVCGTTGEASTMSVSEHLKCVEFAVERVNERVPVIAGTGNNCTKKATELSVAASKLGCDAILVVTPYYNKASDEGLIRHFSLIADVADCPLILYNVPSRTGVNIPLPVYKKLSKHGNIKGVKEASGNISAIASLFAECSDKFKIYSGNDDQILPILSLGGQGVISVVSNILPRKVQMLCKKFASNDTASAARLQCDLNEISSAMFCEVNPIPVKYALSLMEACRAEWRLPLCEPSDVSKEKIRKVMIKYGLI